MPRAIYSPEAEEDLGKIAEYIARDDLLAAVSWLDQTKATCELLAVQRAIGQRVTTKRFPDARRHVIGNYLIYYRPVANSVEILMVVHGARDQGRLI